MLLHCPSSHVRKVYRQNTPSLIFFLRIRLPISIAAVATTLLQNLFRSNRTVIEQLGKQHKVGEVHHNGTVNCSIDYMARSRRCDAIESCKGIDNESDYHLRGLNERNKRSDLFQSRTKRFELREEREPQIHDGMYRKVHDSKPHTGCVLGSQS